MTYLGDFKLPELPLEPVEPADLICAICEDTILETETYVDFSDDNTTRYMHERCE